MPIPEALGRFITGRVEDDGLRRLDRREKELWFFSALVVIGSLAYFLLLLTRIGPDISQAFLDEANYYTKLLMVLLADFAFYVFHTHRKLTGLRRRIWEAGEIVKERNAQLQNAIEQLERSYDHTLEALGGALDLKDSGTEGHSKRVTAFSIAIARAMGVSDHEVQIVARGAYLHDIGKIAVPDAILRKPGPLTEQEREIIRKHCEYGWQMLGRISFLAESAEIVYSHQERYDGTGYPRGLRGEQIHLGARIFSVADALDAMLSDRPYRAALPLREALRELGAMAGTQFDPAVVRAALSLPIDLWEHLASGIGKGYGLAAAAGGGAGPSSAA